jgi:hypothetical protein
VHRTVFDTGSRTFTLRLADLGVLIDAAARTVAPGLAAQVPPTLSATVARVAGGDFGTATDVAKGLSGARILGVWLLVVGLVAVVLSVAVGSERMRAVRRVAVAAVAIGLVALVVVVVARWVVLRQFSAGDARSAAAALWDAFFADVRFWALLVGVVGGVAWLAIVWPSAAGAVRTRGQQVAAAGRTVRSASIPRAAQVGIALVALVAAVIVLAGSPQGEPALAHPLNDCNGAAQLCDRPLDRVAFAATHNAMGSSTLGWLFPNQDGGLSDQLGAGIRALLIDTHYGIKATRGVATKLTAQTRKLAVVVDKVGPNVIAEADRLRASIGFDPAGAPSAYLCHAFCELGATPLLAGLGEIRDFLVAHPHQVVILSVEDDITPSDTEAAFRQSGLLDLVYQGPSGPPWPTLRQLIEEDRRVIVFAENKTGGIPWYRPQFELMEETPYHFRSTAALEAPESCRLNRGGSGKSLFLLNNWVDTTPTPRPLNATIVDAYATLLARARRCESQRHRLPNLIAVDFYKRGDVLRVAATLNGVP